MLMAVIKIGGVSFGMILCVLFEDISIISDKIIKL